MGKLRQIAVINGMEVWSDKEGGISIENDELTFEDGSSCDTKKGKIINAGKGSIELRSAETPETRSQIVIGPKTFDASGLVIENISADIKIEPHEKKTIEVTISGTQTDCDTIGLNEIAGQLHIEHQDAPVQIFGQREPEQKEVKKMGFIDSIKNFLRTPISMKVSVNVIIDSKPAIKIKVPKTTKISIKDTDGKLNIGDTEGVLELEIDESSDIEIGKIKDAVLVSSGDGNINIERVDGTLVAKIEGYGDITIENGSVKNLRVESSDDGHFVFKGESQNANLKSTGYGDIRIGKIDGTLVARQTGCGNIIIDEGIIKDLEISTEDDGNFEFCGKAEKAKLKTNDDGYITVNEVSGNVEAVVGDNAYGDIIIKEGELESFVAKINGSADIKFNGRTKNSDLSINDGADGNIYVEFSENRPYKDNDGDGDITVGNWQKK